MSSDSAPAFPATPLALMYINLEKHLPGNCFVIIGLVAMISSCATEPTTSGKTTFLYQNKLAVAGDLVLRPVSVIGVYDGKERGGNTDPDGTSRFDVRIADASTVVLSPDGNTMSNPAVKEVNGQLQITWDEIDDYHTGVFLKYDQGSISQTKLR